MNLDPETIQKIDTALSDWESVEESVRAPVDVEIKQSESALESVLESMRDSERFIDLSLRVD